MESCFLCTYIHMYETGVTFLLKGSRACTEKSNYRKVNTKDEQV